MANPSLPMRPYASGLNRGPVGPSAGSANTQHAARIAERERIQQQQQQQGQAAAQAQLLQGRMEDLSEEQREEINEAFHLFDLDRDSHIDYHEFKVALKALGFDLPKPEISSLLQSHGVPLSSLSQPANARSKAAPQQSLAGPNKLVLPLAAFQSILAAKIAARDPRDEINRAFDLFDADGKGGISVEDLRRVARELNEGLQEEELIAMVEEFDLEGKGWVGREEFLGICMS